MRLSEFIVAHVDSIVDEWEDFAKTLKPAADTMSRVELRDHAKSIMLAAARDMDAVLSKRAQAIKTPKSALNLDEAAASHGELRHTVGFDLVQMTSEFRHLRASVIRLWSESLSAPEPTAFEDMIRFNEVIDEALAESTAAYVEQVTRSRDMFLAILGHDLRAPLQAVSMSTEMLMRKEQQDEKTRAYISQIKNSTRHMGVMVADLLEFVRSRLGASLPVERKPMDLAVACREAIEEACAGQPTSTPHLKIEGNTLGEWDSSRIGQLLQNLIGNALQHGTSNNEVTVKVTGWENSVELIVHNDGEPIAEEAIGTIFDPMVRSVNHDSDTRQPSTSLGLGLFIVKEVVNAHAGSITVTSNIGEGTTFTVVLPRGV
ncbi:HAMP domain-containing histidine kinase [Pseudomonas cichorii]|nr:HAMP domain-containing sensor histidine kinase [Pseudomonas cichorii]MBX8512003.1 HAMP domain-containing histidine kinase [Pseudomonas cichorii]MBX8522094.1 HAMP domain-containing histidine kinase [Pseudomonas cichorii]MBX8526983.1 HAMP domain-containing histidine kinase [Pseudomonas cichorii]MBX8572144.1 HAMP domain-containing histidine kinase [Pseudomonas cichorii]